MNGRLATVVVLAAGLFGLAACSSSTPGTGTPVQSSQPPSSSGTTTGNGGAALAALQPCDLLDSSVQSQNGVISSGPKSGSGARSCRWTKKVSLNAPGFVIGADIRDSQGISDFTSDGYAMTNESIGHHQAVQAKQTSGDVCVVIIGVTPTSRVDVTANTSDSDIDAACTLANQYAKLIEPKLP
ncbi:MAG TPA: DUF3558 family protein [Pseudonocardiaceae bacterium]|nr:DUF3558 family protein [Pseudonocardiaceae bacterium]